MRVEKKRTKRRKKKMIYKKGSLWLYKNLLTF